MRSRDQVQVERSKRLQARAGTDEVLHELNVLPREGRGAAAHNDASEMVICSVFWAWDAMPANGAGPSQGRPMKRSWDPRRTREGIKSSTVRRDDERFSPGRMQPTSYSRILEGTELKAYRDETFIPRSPSNFLKSGRPAAGMDATTNSSFPQMEEADGPRPLPTAPEPERRAEAQVHKHLLRRDHHRLPQHLRHRGLPGAAHEGADV
ncbi:hypothetical protein BDK51DRAFT_49432 [Blyttiomyces helicus]|uniref:Uncharacterized protein n=1 Tax=Blyttiomyces helicus TaxID=388810 RepID=A0A4P9VTL5_9FUNG|nr:hypothetical protein BDK51DRAFT_49432 [Blyttiomyces helicus]|eukprot:RKO82864.1 hypothetical protein BDK51DRAFT_49432 [Blyttiomyces helicus]